MAPAWHPAKPALPGRTRRAAGNPSRGILLLPEPERPMCIIFDEGGGNWAVESSDGSRHSIKSGDTLRVADRTWRIELPAAPEHTWQPDVSEPTFNVHAPDFRWPGLFAPHAACFTS